MSDLDLEFLGRRLPGNSDERVLLSKRLIKLVEVNGKKWVWDCRDRLLLEAQMMIDLKILRGPVA